MDIRRPHATLQPLSLVFAADSAVAAATTAGWEKPWVEQIIDRIMKGSLKTTEERTQGVVSGRACCTWERGAVWVDAWLWQ